MEVFGAVGLICYIIFNFNIYKYSFYHSIICIIQSTTVIFYSRRELNISLKVIYTLFPYTMFLSLPLYRNFAYAAAMDSNANCFWKMYSEYKRLLCIGEIYSYVAIVLYSSRSHWSIQFVCELKWWRKKKRGTVEKKIPSCVALSKGFFFSSPAFVWLKDTHLNILRPPAHPLYSILTDTLWRIGW